MIFLEPVERSALFFVFKGVEFEAIVVQTGWLASGGYVNVYNLLMIFEVGVI